MPHDVIMPALGMAQETGRIVAWLKKPGDAVRAGEPLMEVETDKATVEVEAQEDGRLGDLRAAEGDDVPVGSVVAVIAGEDEAPPVTGTAANGGGSEGARDDGSTGAEAPDRLEDEAPSSLGGVEVIMPALGMSQDSGRIVAWLKEHGDAVTEGEALVEVETDKATVEVEAQAAGFLADLQAEAGADVPVGEVIAVIAAEKPEASAARTGEGGSETAAGARPGASGRAADDDAAAVTDGANREPPRRPLSERPVGDVQLACSASSAAGSGRVLASPLARRLAAERGLDLARLAAGRSTPVHVADLDALADAAAPDAASQDATAAPAAASAPMHVAAEAPAGELDALIAWAAAEDAPLAPSRALAAFAAAALREATGHHGPLALRLARAGRPASTLADPDRGPLSAEPDATDAEPHLILRDLSGTHLTSQSAAETAPTLTVARRGEVYALRLDHDAGRLDSDAAAALLAGVAARVDDPLRHLF